VTGAPRLFRVLAAAAWLAGAGWADQVVMKNGDRITGTIEKQDGKTITVKTADFGSVTAPWDQVASVESDQPVHIALKDGKTLVGKLAPAGEKVRIAEADTTVDVSPADFTAIRGPDEEKAYERMLHPTWFQLWVGNLSIGWAGTEGNAKTNSFTTAFTAARQTNTDKTIVNFKAIKASALIDNVTANTAQAFSAGIEHDHNVNKRLFVNVFNNYDYDKFQELNLRFTIGGGFGYQAVKTAASGLKLVGGADYNHESFTTLTRSVAEGFWGDDYSLKLSSASTLVQSFRMFNGANEYRVNADLNLTTKVKKWLTWNLALSDSFLSDPVPGRKTNDWLYTTGFGIAFAQ
jgi:putative salt-induced outer membrane protein YdiY